MMTNIQQSFYNEISIVGIWSTSEHLYKIKKNLNVYKNIDRLGSSAKYVLPDLTRWLYSV